MTRKSKREIEATLDELEPDPRHGEIPEDASPREVLNAIDWTNKMCKAWEAGLRQGGENGPEE